MATAAKAQKDKPLGSTPRLLPRPTAASAARAARNATNRNLAIPNQHKQSPNRGPQASPKMKTSLPRAQKSESKTEANIEGNEAAVINNISPLQDENDKYIIENSPEITESTNDEINDQVAEESDDTYIQENGESVPVPGDNFLIDPSTATDVQDTAANDPGSDDNHIQEESVPEIQQLRAQENEDAEKHDESEAQEHINDDSKTETKSRPTTPAPLRPQTPRSILSRPQTPRIPSRPTTPAHPNRQTTPYSRPITPQRFSTNARPKTASSNVLPSGKNVSRASLQNSAKEDDLKSTFVIKRKQFQLMKKELDLKQQAVLELFDNLRGMQERMSREGVSGYGEGVQLEELVVFNVADWASEEVSKLCRDATASSATDCAIEVMNSTSHIDESALEELDAQVADVPARFADLCLQAFTARQEIIDWVKELIEKDENRGGGESLERIAQYNAHGLELCEHLRELKSCADNAVDTVTQLSKQACKERSALESVGESLVREIARLRQDLDSRSAAVNELQEKTKDLDRSKGSEDLRRELEEERTARAALKDKLATTESQLRQARIRITKMDRQLREAEASIASLTVTVNSLEDKSRQKEVQLEARARKLKESLKTGEVTNSQLAQQREHLQAEVQDLKQQIETLTAQHKSAIQELNSHLNEVKCNLEQQCILTQKEIELKEAAEATVTQNENTIDELKAKITELENSRPNPDLPTEREMDLWAELQATKETLRTAEEEVTSCKREKVKFLETLTKITESENKVGIQQKLAAELLSKEEILGKMQIQIRELTKNIKLNEQKVIQYEQYVRDLQAQHRAVANSQEAPNGIRYQDLQQEVMTLRLSLLEAVHRNEEVTEQLMQKEQQLDQQDKTSRAQARLIKVREELINMLKSKETEQGSELAALQQDLEHRMKIVDEVNKQIAAKAEEIQELFATLENKQQQIHRLEKIVLALEEQQRRAQAQRTRHEEKIAALEHELAASGVRRDRKFLFW